MYIGILSKHEYNDYILNKHVVELIYSSKLGANFDDKVKKIIKALYLVPSWFKGYNKSICKKKI